MRNWPLIFCFVMLSVFCEAQNPLINLAEGMQSRFSDKQAIIDYTLTVDTSDLSALTVQIKLENISDTFRLAMYAHPLADDKYWRYVENLTLNAEEGNTVSFREDSALWRFVTHNRHATVTYKIHLPPSRNPRSASKPF